MTYRPGLQPSDGSATTEDASNQATNKNRALQKRIYEIWIEELHRFPPHLTQGSENLPRSRSRHPQRKCEESRF